MMKFEFDVDWIRQQFPACQRQLNGVPVAFLDGPGGTQVPQVVADRISEYYLHHNANEGGSFATSQETGEIYSQSREIIADFLGCSSNEVIFGYSSTANTFALAFALMKGFVPGDEIVITDIDHRCNRAPWLALERFGVVVKSVRVDPETQQIDMADFESKLTPKTKVAAFNWASNALGTVSDVKTMCALAHKVGAITVVDAVHYSAHFPIDVKEIDTDVLIVSAYKFFGPHLGVMYVRESLIDQLEPYNVQTKDLQQGRRKFHQGTPPFGFIAGTAAAVEFIATIGEKHASFFAEELAGLSGRRRNIVAGMLAIDHHEEPLARLLRDEIRSIPGATLYGPKEGEPRTSTIVFTIAGKNSAEVSQALGELGINTWDGNFYAVEVVNKVLGLEETGGLVRIGLAPYTTQQDILRTIAAIKQIAGA